MPAESETTERGLPEALKGLIGLWVLLFAVWLIVNASLALPVVMTGAVISLAIAAIFSRRYGLWQQTALTPGAAYHFLAFASVFFIELVKANVNMLRYVYSPRIDIHPGIVVDIVSGVRVSAIDSPLRNLFFNDRHLLIQRDRRVLCNVTAGQTIREYADGQRGERQG